MKKNIKILFILFSCVICNSCIFEYHDQLAYVVFTDDRKIEYSECLKIINKLKFNEILPDSFPYVNEPTDENIEK